MSRVALLIEVSHCKGMSLPPRARHLEELEHALQQPHLRVDPVSLCSDQDLQTTQASIRTFFQSRNPDDQIIFVLSGYCVRQPDQHFYFATPHSVEGDSNSLVPVSFLQAAMNESPAKQQVMILDCYFRPGTGRETDSLADREALCDLLLQDDRALLTALTVVPPLTEEELEVWSYTRQYWNYTRYLAEGIETGAASHDDAGNLSAADLHDYAARKMHVAAPAVQTKLYGSDREIAHLAILNTGLGDTAALTYRQVLEHLAEQGQVDETGSRLLTSERDELDILLRSSGLEPEAGGTIEFQVVRPIREYRQRVAMYQDKFFDLERRQDISSSQVRQDLERYQQALSLTDNSLALIDGLPYTAEQKRRRERYQEKLRQYEQVVLNKFQSKPSLEPSDRVALERIQRGLQIEDVDAREVEALIANQAQQTLLPQTSIATNPTVMPGSTPTVMPTSGFGPPTEFSHAAVAQPTPPAASSTNPELSVEKQRIIEQLTHLLNASDLSPAERMEIERLQSTLLDGSSSPPPAQMNAAVAATEIPETVNPPRDQRPRASAASSSYSGLAPALIALAVLLTAGLAGYLAYKTFQPSVPNLETADRLRSQGYLQAQQGNNQAAIESYNQAIQLDARDPATYINRGVSHERLGNLNAALQDYNTALSLDPDLALAYSNRSHVYYDLGKAQNNRTYFKNALDDANAAIALTSQLPEAFINLGNARLAVNENPNDPSIQAAAIKDYEQALNTNPIGPFISAYALTNRGNVYLLQKNYQNAFRDYNQAILFNGDSAEAYYNRAVAHQTQNQIPEAIRDYEKAAQLYEKMGQTTLQQQAQQNAVNLRQPSGSV